MSGRSIYFLDLKLSIAFRVKALSTNFPLSLFEGFAFASGMFFAGFACADNYVISLRF